MSTLVVERLAEPDPTLKAGAINVPTSVTLNRIGLGGRLAQAQDRQLAKMAGMFTPGATPDGAIPNGAAPDPDAIRQRMRGIGGHFGGLFKLDPSRLTEDDPDMDDGARNAIVVVPQQEIERILGEYAAELGVHVDRIRRPRHECDRRTGRRRHDHRRLAGRL